MKKNAIISGATGLIGSFLLDQLLEDQNWGKVVSLVRKPSRKKHEKLEELVMDFDQLALPSDSIRIDTAFCCLGTTMKKAGSQEAFYKVDFTYVESFARLALKAGASHFLLVSAMGANPHSGIFYNRVKGEIESLISGFGFHSVSILQPSLLLGSRKEKRLGESVGKVLAKTLNPIIPAKYKGIKAETVAKAMQLLARENNEGAFIYPSDVIRKIVKAR